MTIECGFCRQSDPCECEEAKAFDWLMERGDKTATADVMARILADYVREKKAKEMMEGETK